MVKHFTRDNLSWTSLNKYPEASFKGSDTRLILGFLVDVLANRSAEMDALEMAAYSGAKAVQDFLVLIFSVKKPFLSIAQGLKCVSFLNLYLERTYVCAKTCYDCKLHFFNLTPKFHYIAHIMLDMQFQLLSCGGADEILNPAIFATQAAEDWVGKTCCIGRTVHPANVAKRSAQKWLIAVKLEWDKVRAEKMCCLLCAEVCFGMWNCLVVHLPIYRHAQRRVERCE